MTGHPRRHGAPQREKEEGKNKGSVRAARMADCSGHPIELIEINALYVPAGIRLFYRGFLSATMAKTVINFDKWKLSRHLPAVFMRR